MVIIAGNFSLNFGHISGVKLESCILEMSHIKAFEFSRAYLLIKGVFILQKKNWIIVAIVVLLIIVGWRYYDSRWERYFIVKFIGYDFALNGDGLHVYEITNNTNRHFFKLAVVFKCEDILGHRYKYEEEFYNLKPHETKEVKVNERIMKEGFSKHLNREATFPSYEFYKIKIKQ
jgi:hypothetical protein